MKKLLVEHKYDSYTFEIEVEDDATDEEIIEEIIEADDNLECGCWYYNWRDSEENESCDEVLKINI